jgi:hypothetical protein
LQPVTKDNDSCLAQFRPTFTRTLYNAQVNILRTHLSGLLLIKLMPDSSTRLVFSTETGFKFFDFEFDSAGKFSVHYILEKMNRKAVIKTLHADFELMLMKQLVNRQAETLKKGDLLYHRYAGEEDFDYYITDSNCNKLIRVEKAGNKKPSMQMIMQNYFNGVPDTIGITHSHFKFNIGLKRLETAIVENNDQ